MHAMAKMARIAKNRQPLAIWIGCQSSPLEAGDLGENGEIGDFGENRQTAGDNGDKRLGLAILAKMATVAKLVILAKITRELAISRMCQNIQLGRQKWPLQSR